MRLFFLLGSQVKREGEVSQPFSTQMLPGVCGAGSSETTPPPQASPGAWQQEGRSSTESWNALAWDGTSELPLLLGMVGKQSSALTCRRGPHLRQRSFSPPFGGGGEDGSLLLGSLEVWEFQMLPGSCSLLWHWGAQLVSPSLCPMSSSSWVG